MSEDPRIVGQAGKEAKNGGYCTGFNMGRGGRGAECRKGFAGIKKGRFPSL